MSILWQYRCECWGEKDLQNFFEKLLLNKNENGSDFI